MNVFWDPRNASHRASVKLICIANDSILLIRAKWKETFNLVGWAVDIWEHLEDAIQREFLEETGNALWDIKPKLLHVEIKTFPAGWQFDGVVNIFYGLSFDKKFDITLEEWIYEESKRATKEELQNTIVSDHSNKGLLLSLL